MKIILSSLIFIYVFCCHSTCFAVLKIVATNPDLAYFASRIGEGKAEVQCLTSGMQDQHYIQAKPSMISKVRLADILCYNGADLEVGWLPTLMGAARNSNILEGQPGNFNASEGIIMLDVPQSADRALGDIHPQGNPHFLLDPRNGIVVAERLAARMGLLDPGSKEFFQGNIAAYKEELGAHIKRWEAMAGPLRGQKVIAYHKTWVYFLEWLGIKEVGTIEPLPGISSSPAHIQHLIQSGKTEKPMAVIAEGYQNPKPSNYTATNLGIPFYPLPIMTGGEEKIKSYSDLFETIISKLMGKE